MSSQSDAAGGGQDRPPPTFSDVFLEHHDMCLHVARRLLRDEVLAHDVVQDVFLAWWRADGGSYRAERGALAAWLTTITHHKAVDAVRTAERHARLQRAARAELEVTPQACFVDDEVWWGLGIQAVREALASLPSKQREVLDLVYLSGLTQAEVAHRLGIPLGTVKSRTHAGLLRLKAAVSGTWTPAGADPSDVRTSGTSCGNVHSVSSTRWGAPTVEDDVRRCAAELVQLATGARTAAAAEVMRPLTLELVEKHGVDSLHELAQVLSALAARGSAVGEDAAGTQPRRSPQA